jgi:hypothetical protein
MLENLQRGVAVVQRQGHSTLRRAPRSDRLETQLSVQGSKGFTWSATE